MKITVEKTSGFHCEECGRKVKNEEEAIVLHKKGNKLEVFCPQCCQLTKEVKNILGVVWRLVLATSQSG